MCIASFLRNQQNQKGLLQNKISSRLQDTFVCSLFFFPFYFPIRKCLTILFYFSHLVQAPVLRLGVLLE